MGDDAFSASPPEARSGFLSTSPVWGTTPRPEFGEVNTNISIHVPRMGDDTLTKPLSFCIGISIHVPRMGDDPDRRFPHPHGWCYFYPRPPYGGRQDKLAQEESAEQFLSTSPVWGTTVRRWKCAPTFSISIHVPRMGDDPVAQAIFEVMQDFYPRPPYGGRHITAGVISSSDGISIHVPRMGDDKLPQRLKPTCRDFYPRPPYGGRPTA